MMNDTCRFIEEKGERVLFISGPASSQWQTSLRRTLQLPAFPDLTR
jgi:hypothetical protein